MLGRFSRGSFYTRPESVIEQEHTEKEQKRAHNHKASNNSGTTGAVSGQNHPTHRAQTAPTGASRLTDRKRLAQPTPSPSGEQHFDDEDSEDRVYELQSHDYMQSNMLDWDFADNTNNNSGTANPGGAGSVSKSKTALSPSPTRGKHSETKFTRKMPENGFVHVSGSRYCKDAGLHRHSITAVSGNAPSFSSANAAATSTRAKAQTARPQTSQTGVLSSLCFFVPTYLVYLYLHIYLYISYILMVM